jgi:L-malate glycosyltransferase
MLELVSGLRERGVDVLVASPPGPLQEQLQARGVAHRAVPGTTASFKVSASGYARAGADIVRSAKAVRAVAREHGAELVHANSIRSGLVAGLAARSGGPPAVVHARDSLAGGPVGAAVRAGLTATASHVIAISRHVEASLRLRRPPVTVVHNPVDLRRFDPARANGADLRAQLGTPLLGVIAQITPWKGQDDAIRMLPELPGVHLAIVGEAKFVGRDVTFDNVTYRRGLDSLVQELGVADRVHFLGEREDVPDVIAALDLLLVPSWEEPFGRTVIEGMAMGRTVLATAAGGPPEIITDGVDGRLLPPRQPAVWARAAAELLQRDREAIGQAARATAARFDRDAYADEIVALYERVIARRASRRGRGAPTPPAATSGTPSPRPAPRSRAG